MPRIPEAVTFYAVLPDTQVIPGMTVDRLYDESEYDVAVKAARAQGAVVVQVQYGYSLDGVVGDFRVKPADVDIPADDARHVVECENGGAYALLDIYDVPSRTLYTGAYLMGSGGYCATDKAAVRHLRVLAAQNDRARIITLSDFGGERGYVQIDARQLVIKGYSRPTKHMSRTVGGNCLRCGIDAAAIATGAYACVPHRLEYALSCQLCGVAAGAECVQRPGTHPASDIERQTYTGGAANGRTMGIGIHAFGNRWRVAP